LELERIPVALSRERAVDAPIRVGEREYRMTCVSMGNPHAVVFVENVGDMELEQIGPMFECHELFPNRTNTEFVEVVDRRHVKMRVWERGTGETLACGTGCCATAVACVLNGLTDNQVTVEVLGGEIEVAWDREENLVYMTGPAATVFEGEIKYPDMD
ncbi:MAG: diaminopimelate epimerase, partial [Acetatifactor sp.]|nr:diaminopimelate epimerase [Acetatifactor sp.]